MNSVTDVAPVITAANHALKRDFPHKPFAIRHKLAGHPLLTLPRIAQLASELPRDLIEYNSGKVAISQDPDAIPSVDLDPVEVVKSIETAGAWMVLKRVENSPEYRALLEDTLLSVARARGFNSLLDAGFEQVEGFLFVSSPNSTTPFHLDSEDNFFVHIHGEKFFTIFDNNDRAIVSDDEIERSMTKHRNLKYDDSFAPRGSEFHLFAGDGCYVPYQWPHWVRTANSHSISMAITWKTREVRRLNDLHFFNSMLRGVGLPQQPPGRQPLRDALKLAFYRTVTTAIKPLRASLAMRRVLRRIALGKRANYYLKRARGGSAAAELWPRWSHRSARHPGALVGRSRISLALHPVGRGGCRAPMRLAARQGFQRGIAVCDTLCFPPYKRSAISRMEADHFHLGDPEQFFGA
jgi:hypothetical protein